MFTYEMIKNDISIIENFKSRELVPLCCNWCKKLYHKKKHDIQISLLDNSINNYCSRKCSSTSKRNRIVYSCYNCGNTVEKIKSHYNKTNNHFCSTHCSTTFHNKIRKITNWKISDESKEKISFSLQEHYKNNVSKLKKEKLPIICKMCNKEFIPHTGKYFCSKDCQNKHMSISKTGKKTGRRKTYAGKEILENSKNKEFYLYCLDSQWDFGKDELSKIPGNQLLSEYGIYHSIKNKNGLVRDHMFSRKEGFLRGISPEIIKHPANCQFITNIENVIKGKKCCITIEELLERIKNWNSSIKTSEVNFTKNYYTKKPKSTKKNKKQSRKIVKIQKNSIIKEVKRNHVPQYKKYGWEMID